MTVATTEPGAEKTAADQAAAIQQAATAARTAERARVAGITGSEEAKGRSTLANHLAMKTEMSVEEAKAVLAASPAEKTDAAKPNGFEAAMATTGNPNVGANAGTEEGTEGGQKTSNDLASQILGAQAQATGLKLVSSK